MARNLILITFEYNLKQWRRKGSRSLINFLKASESFSHFPDLSRNLRTIMQTTVIFERVQEVYWAYSKLQRSFKAFSRLINVMQVSAS